MEQLITRLTTARWKTILLGVVLYIGIGQFVHYLPNPMVPEAIIALNMTIVVIMAYFTGPWEGALIGLVGTLGNFLFKLLIRSVDFYELAAVLPHTVMGAYAGWLAIRDPNKERKIITALCIFVGHGLNVAVFIITGLLALQQIASPVFWSGLLTEGIIDIIVILLVISIVENARTEKAWRPLSKTYLHKHMGLIVVILALSLTLLWLFLGGIRIAGYMTIIPVLLASLTLGHLEAWLLALLLSIPITWHIVSGNNKALSFTSEELTALALTLNLVALTVGEMAETLKQQKELALRQADELQKAYFELKRADHMKAEMIQNISHELRTPLSLIVGYAELLTTGMLERLTPEQRRATEAIYTHGRHLAYLVEQVTILHQVEQGHISLQPTSLVNLVQTCIEKRRMWAVGHKCPLHFDLRNDIPMLELDAEYLGRAIDALIDNAVKFSPEGGNVEISLWRDSERIYLAVRDHGIGIAPKDHERLFKRFSQVDASTTRRFGGMGTGLALVKEVVNAHQGDVWFESAPGQGSTFGFWLPLHPQGVEELWKAPKTDERG